MDKVRLMAVAPGAATDCAAPALAGTKPRSRPIFRSVAVAAILALPVAASAFEPVREPLPGSVVRESQDTGGQSRAGQLDATVSRESGGTDITQPSPSVSPYRLPQKKPGKAPGELDALNTGWEQLSAGDPQAALESFETAATSKDTLLAREASLGAGYALWRLGRESQAEGIFKALVDQDFRLPEVLPNLLFLLRKRGGAKAVEPYLKYLPEDERDIWRK
ncbi:hypothetical protein [Fundidesulfovibrio terrae]|uniref:hypothetical protein n=1 Tax=Fundidesulfovibrio terrae TaxID=2922866 RepID=UPI001FAF3499|nr:hypothetical protein [Fundidesulfovibrio terrae]